MQDVDVVFVSGQGMSTLVSQQVQHLDRLKRLLVTRIGASHPIFDVNENNENQVVKGDYMVTRSNSVNLIWDCGLYIEEIFNKLNPEEQHMAWTDVAVCVLSLIEGIQTILARAEVSGTSSAFPPVLPHQLVKLRSYEFNVTVNEQAERYKNSRQELQF
mmetsp:Transcript_16076/g.22894  ORF Transcript_16076/g.22894 Transcript_16076/m.22894 type:complete len:159 (+) Transcript_16076:1316-1792(+)|eukprot:CAMPEP_0184870098 /NCGR_PEP_ID=MMETSP0580-20130426/36482_1 /TAXON_ID=1118495 /ORGANISM="Dactyliosolen fragilissimus" /LENGTH=158 /DNA_ID=CAMNT_0027372019 /DNA_START=1253 /DNA_END=1729 /DNA_ORIENTATION=+